MDCSELQDQHFTGIDVRPDDRHQPFAVWYDGQIVRFTGDPAEADETLDDYRTNGPPVDRKTVYNRGKEEF